MHNKSGHRVTWGLRVSTAESHWRRNETSNTVRGREFLRVWCRYNTRGAPGRFVEARSSSLVSHWSSSRARWLSLFCLQGTTWPTVTHHQVLNQVHHQVNHQVHHQGHHQLHHQVHHPVNHQVHHQVHHQSHQVLNLMVALMAGIVFFA